MRASIDGRDYWLDGTRRGDLDITALDTPFFGFALPVRPAGATLIHLQPDPPAKPLSLAVIKFDASKGLDQPAPAHVEVTLRGDAATVMRLTVDNLAQADLDRDLRDYWRQTYDELTVDTTKAVFDPATGTETLIADGHAKLDWSGGYEPYDAALGWSFDITRDASAINPDAPFAVAYPMFKQTDVSITLPNGGQGFKVLGDQVDRQLAGYALHRDFAIENGVFHMRTSTRALAPEIPFAQAKADAGALTQLGKTSIRVAQPGVSLAAVGLDDLMKTTPTDVSGYMARESALLNAHRYREALADAESAVKLDPKSGYAYAGRAMAHLWLGEVKAAEADADQAELLDPRQPMIYRTRGLLAERTGDWPRALANFTRSVDIAPEAFGYWHRAQAYFMTKDYVRTLRDLDTMLTLQSNDAWSLWVHAFKARTYAMMERKDDARAELNAAKPDFTADPAIEQNRLMALSLIGDDKGAMAEADAAIAAHPTDAAYLARLSIRPSSDLAGREADAKAAYALNPQSLGALSALAYARQTAKDYEGELGWLDKLHTAAPGDMATTFRRILLEVKLGRIGAARADFAAIREASKTDALQLNNICYEQAMANLDLETALADCNASLALKPSGNTYDSRGFVFLRLGRNKDALADYDRAVAENPGSAISLYGRSLAERRLGRVAAADRDRATAFARSPGVAAIYAEYGVTK